MDNSPSTKIYFLDSLDPQSRLKESAFTEKIHVYDSVSTFSSIRDFYSDLKDMLPYYESEGSSEFDYIIRMAENSFKSLEFMLFKVGNVFNFDLCDLPEIIFWEKELGIMSDQSLSLVNRRNIVRAKTFSVFNDFNLKSLETFIRLFGSNSFYYDVSKPAKEINVWVSLDESLKTRLQEMVEDFKPAHLTVNIYNYKNWDYALSLGDWKDVKEYGEWYKLEISGGTQ